jgi:hypothetical protein
MNIEQILKKYNIDYRIENEYYYINGVPHYITFAQEVNNEPDNLRIQTARKSIQDVIRTHVNDDKIKVKIWALYPEENSCKVAEFFDGLDDVSLLQGNKSLKFKKSDYGDPGTVVLSKMLYNAKLFHLYNKEEEEEPDLKLNIQPESDIYSFFKNMNYKPWNAISEFVDNSTASYFEGNHQIILNSLGDFDHLQINIDYYNDEKMLIVEDNAYGMSLKDFKRAFRLKDAPQDKSGRNEFGMGLKTAAFWFGKKLTVISTEYGSNKEYELTLDTDILDEQKLKNMTIIERKVPISNHGTRVIIEKIYSDRELVGGRTIGRIGEELTTIYRRDLLGINSLDTDRKVEIRYNGKKLQVENQRYISVYNKMYDYLDLFKEKNHDYPYLLDLEKKEQLFKKFTFNIDHLNKFYHVKCIMGFLNQPSAKNAGFILYRRGRVIEGNIGRFNKPEAIFGAPNSFESQRLFGEIDLDEIQVSQSKDSFLWPEELQDKIYSEILERIKDLIFIIRNFKKEDKLPEGYEVENTDPTKVISVINERQVYKSSSELDELSKRNIENQVAIIKEQYFKDNQKVIDDKIAEEILEYKSVKKPSSEIYEWDGIRYKIIYKNMGDFISIFNSESDNSDYDVYINVSHDFLANFTLNLEFLTVITEFSLAIVTSDIKFNLKSNALSGENKVNLRYIPYINKFISNRSG